jgi:translation initiation factor IF-1
MADKLVEAQGVVLEVLPNTQFRVQLENGHTVLAYLGGRMKKNHIKVIIGDRVTMGLSPYDLTRGRITFRQK